VVRATAPVADMVQAIQAAGLPARASSEPGDYVGNFTLYRVLAEFGGEDDGRMVGCLSIPARARLDDVEAAVKAAAQAFAVRLTSPRPASVSA
jgi:pyrrolidone-carboxylate peptidase